MFEFLPDWIKSLMGSGLVLLIIIAGFTLTTKKDGNKPDGK